ncbi:MAG: hypothetical protein IPK55_12095 [Streptococcus sp.]|nr:hypothetical protein [Streptococcus sp.]
MGAFILPGVTISVKLDSGLTPVSTTAWAPCILTTQKFSDFTFYNTTCTCSWTAGTSTISMLIPGTYPGPTVPINLYHELHIGKILNYDKAGTFGNTSVTISTFTFENLAWTYTPDTLTSASILTDSAYAGVPSKHTITFVTKNAVPAGSLVYV